MITSIRLVNFKNFADETLRLGPFTILVGANASGKSNIRDAFRFLSGIGRGYTLAEIFGGKREAGWKPIRGAMNEIVRFDASDLSPTDPVTLAMRRGPRSLASELYSGHASFSLEVGLRLNGKEFRYSIEVGHSREPSVEVQFGPFRVQKEELRVESKTVYTTDPDHPASLRANTTDQPFLTQYVMPGRTQRLLNDQDSVALRDALADMRFLEPSPERMREPSFPGATVLGDCGENLSTALQEVRADVGRQETLASWLQELTPMDVEDFEFPLDPSGRTHLTIREKNNRRVSAYSASDGTLRFLAMLTALFCKNPPGLYFLEEIDTGIHPVRLYLLMDLIERQAAKRGIQVVATTHAPTLLTVMNDDTFENSSVVCRLEDKADAIIRPLATLPDVRDLRQDQGLGRLHESGWMENMLFFSEEKENEEADGE